MPSMMGLSSSLTCDANLGGSATPELIGGPFGDDMSNKQFQDDMQRLFEQQMRMDERNRELANRAAETAARMAEEAARRAADEAARFGREMAEQAARDAARHTIEQAARAGAWTKTPSGKVVPDFSALPSPTFAAEQSWGKLSEAARLWAARLSSEVAKLGDDPQLSADAKQWIVGVEAWMTAGAHAGDHRLTPTISAEAIRWQRDGDDIRHRLLAEMTARSQRELAACVELAQANTQATDAVVLRVANALRTAFAAEDQHRVGELGGMVRDIMKMEDSFDEARRQSADASQDALQCHPDAAFIYHKAFERLTSGLKALHDAVCAADFEQGAGKLTEAATAVAEATAVFSALETLAGLASGSRLFVNSVITPLAVGAVTKLREFTSSVRASTPAGTTCFAFSSIPTETLGGVLMRDYLTAAMAASALAAVPNLPPAVGSYIMSRRRLFDAATDSDVPMRGILLWRRLDASATVHWIFLNRRVLWLTLYGSEVAPA